MLPTPTLFFPVYPLSKSETCRFSHPHFCPPSDQTSTSSCELRFQNLRPAHFQCLKALTGGSPCLDSCLLFLLAPGPPFLPSAGLHTAAEGSLCWTFRPCPVGLNPPTGLIPRSKQKRKLTNSVLGPLRPASSLQPPLCRPSLETPPLLSPFEPPPFLLTSRWAPPSSLQATADRQSSSRKPFLPCRLAGRGSSVCLTTKGGTRVPAARACVRPGEGNPVTVGSEHRRGGGGEGKEAALHSPKRGCPSADEGASMGAPTSITPRAIWGCSTAGVEHLGLGHNLFLN